MKLYEAVKATVQPKMAAEHYGLEVNHSGMTCCPFHNDRNPSLKLNEDYYYCFGCGAHGDVIDLTAKLFKESNYEAAKRLITDFGISTGEGWEPIRRQSKTPLLQEFQQEYALCVRIMTDYLYQLKQWKERYVPKTPEEEMDDRFVEACLMLNSIEYMTDILMFSEPEKQVEVVEVLMTDGTIMRVLDRLIKIAEEEENIGTESKDK